MSIILQKYIVDSGHCSRRQATELIRSGKVSVNGVVAEAGRRVDLGDCVEIGGKKLIAPEKKTYVMINKPKGYTCTRARFKNEKNVFALVAKEYDGLHIAGRLDKDSHGLVVLTNDGDFTKQMTHPRHGHEKEYLVTIAEFAGSSSKHVIGKLIYSFLNGIDIGEDDGLVRAKRFSQLGKNKFRIILTQGKKRQIRRMFSALGLRVHDLQRIRIAEINLGDLAEGKSRVIDIRKK